MCNTNHHIIDDNLLVSITPEEVALLFDVIRSHRYEDECCRVTAEDGPPRWKHAEASQRWSSYAGTGSYGPTIRARKRELLAREEIVTDGEELESVREG